MLLIFHFWSAMLHIPKHRQHWRWRQHGGIHASILSHVKYTTRCGLKSKHWSTLALKHISGKPMIISYSSVYMTRRILDIPTAPNTPTRSRECIKTNQPLTRQSAFLDVLTSGWGLISQHSWSLQQGQGRQMSTCRCLYCYYFLIAVSCFYSITPLLYCLCIVNHLIHTFCYLYGI